MLLQVTLFVAGILLTAFGIGFRLDSSMSEQSRDLLSSGFLSSGGLCAFLLFNTIELVNPQPGEQDFITTVKIAILVGTCLVALVFASTLISLLVGSKKQSRYNW